MRQSTEAEVLQEIRGALGAEPDLLLMRNNTGRAHEFSAGGERRIPYGLGVGSPDLVGVLRAPRRGVSSSDSLCMWVCLDCLDVKSATPPPKNSGHLRLACLARGVGSPDLVGVLRRGVSSSDSLGMWVCLEVKSATGRQSPAQKQWEAKARSFGAFYAVVRSVAEARAALTRARAGLLE